MIECVWKLQSQLSFVYCDVLIGNMGLVTLYFDIFFLNFSHKFATTSFEFWFTPLKEFPPTKYKFRTLSNKILVFNSV